MGATGKGYIGFMIKVDLILSDVSGDQEGVYSVMMPSIPRAGEIIHYVSSDQGNAIFHVIYVQYDVKGNARASMSERICVHVEICDDDEPFLSGSFRSIAERQKKNGAKLYKHNHLGS